MILGSKGAPQRLPAPAQAREHRHLSLGEHAALDLRLELVPDQPGLALARHDHQRVQLQVLDCPHGRPRAVPVQWLYTIEGANIAAMQQVLAFPTEGGAFQPRFR